MILSAARIGCTSRRILLLILRGGLQGWFSANKRYRYPSQIVSHAVWLYHRFTLSFRDTEEMLASRGVVVSYKTIRQWCLKLAPTFVKTSRKKQGHLGDQWFLDEVFIKINGQLRYLWRAVDKDGCELDILVTKNRDKKAAMKFFKTSFRGQPQQPRRVVTDTVRSYKAALRDLNCESPTKVTTAASRVGFNTLVIFAKQTCVTKFI
ncbi:MAG: IS6 family transposase [Oceanicoccus sp.]